MSIVTGEKSQQVRRHLDIKRNKGFEEGERFLCSQVVIEPKKARFQLGFKEVV